MSNFYGQYIGFGQHIQTPPPVHYHDGSNYGYAMGGDINPSAPMTTNVIERFAFGSSSAGVAVGSLSKIKAYAGGALSSTHGYCMGGWNYIPGEAQPDGGLIDIDKFSFASDSEDASNIGDLQVLRYNVTGNTSSTYGYSTGGHNYSDATPKEFDIIEKFAYASDGDATDVGDVLQLGMQHCGSSNSETHGYINGGSIYYSNTPSSSEFFDQIQKFSFSSDGDSVDVSNLLGTERTYTDNLQSSTYGYVGGNVAVPVVAATERRIEKYSFAAGTNSTSVGDLTRDGDWVNSVSQSTHGYTIAGSPSYAGGTNRSNIIDRFSFASDGDATDVGDLTESKYAVAGSYF